MKTNKGFSSVRGHSRLPRWSYWGIILFSLISFIVPAGWLPALTFGVTVMRRWDRLVVAYLEEYRARGFSTQAIKFTNQTSGGLTIWATRAHFRIGATNAVRQMLTHLSDIVPSGTTGDSTFYGSCFTVLRSPTRLQLIYRLETINVRAIIISNKKARHTAA